MTPTTPMTPMTATRTVSTPHAVSIDAPFSYRIARPSPDVAVVTLQGELDLRTAPVLLGGLFNLLELAEDAPTDLEIDLHDVDFIDASGFRVFVVIQRRLTDHDGRLVLRNPSPAAAHSMKVFGWDAVLTLEAPATVVLP